jgi:hypothetical protein
MQMSTGRQGTFATTRADSWIGTATALTQAMADPLDDATRSVSNVVSNAIALAKAELRLAVSIAKTQLAKFALATALAGLGLCFVHAAIFLIALSPVLANFNPWPSVVLCIALAVVPGAALLLWARYLFLKEARDEDAGRAETTPGASVSPPPNQIES